jgi:alpha-1,3-mannosyltransferase
VNILQVVRQFHPSVGGIERVVMALMTQLQRRGHRCDVVTLQRLWSERRVLPAREVVAGMRVIRIPFVGGRRMFLAPQVVPLAREYDLIHVHAIDFFVDALAATRWYHHGRLVVSTHGGYFHTPWALGAKRIYFQTATRMALGQTDRVICASEQDNRLFSLIVPAHKRVVIGSGVDDVFFRVRKSVEPGLLLAVGRIAANKRLDRLIDLLPQILREIPEARLVVVGPNREGLQAALEGQAKSRGVEAEVSFVGAADNETLQRYLARADLVLAPSDYEGFGISILEAMATGTTVVANDIGAFRESIHSGTDGFLINFADECAAARAIVSALRLPEMERARLGAAARATASKCTWEAVTERIERVYAQALNGAPRC